MGEQLDPFDALKRRYTRRDLLKMSGRGGMSLAALSLLASCSSGTDTAAGPSGGSPSEFPPLAKQLSVAQWPLYIDRAKGGDHPSLQQFTDETGIQVDYETKINDNQAFFASLTPQLSAGQATGWDLITLSDWVVTRMDSADWLVPMDWSLLPTASETMLPAFKDPAYDPGNAHSVPWQGGLTGVAYYPDKVGGTITSFDQLWDPKLAGHVGMLTEMVDTFGLTFLSMGIDPQQATADDGEKAADKLRQQRDAGIVRKYYGQDYIDDLSRGDLWASMAWSGDIFYYKELGGAPDLEFVVPETGAMIWATCSEMPAGAEHPRDAHAYMDFYYRPEIAALVTDWVLYMTPVKGVQEIMQAKADDPKASAGDRTYYQQLATSPLLFPPEDLAAAKLHPTPVLTEEEFQTFEGQLSSVIEGT